MSKRDSDLWINLRKNLHKKVDIIENEVVIFGD